MPDTPFAPLDRMHITLARQRQAFLDTPPPDLAQRRDQLKRLRGAVLASRADIEDAIHADFGNRSKHETGFMELLAVVQAIDYLLRKLRRFMRPERRHVGLLYRPGRAWVQYQPKGVIGIMAPWNYPFSLTIIPLATALAAGNRAMLKPSELTPRTSEAMRRMLEAIFPADQVAVATGGPDVGAAFSALPFDHLFFTGSTQVGRLVMQAASAHLVPVTLELGGKSPAVIGKGRVDSGTVGSLVQGKLANAGQTCVAPDYVMVHEDDLDTFLQSFHDTVTDFYPQGPGHVDYTSIVSQRHHDRLQGLLDDARRKGARVIPAGATGRARTLAPTLVVAVDDGMALMQEEIFGPILPVLTYRHMPEAVAYINARPRPLALYYFGAEDGDGRMLLERTISGNVGINHTLMHVAQDDLPFGGIGASGMGAYHGIEGFRAMSHARGVYVQGRWSLPRRLHAPYGRLANLALAWALRRR